MKKILVISWFYPPINSSAGMRKCSENSNSGRHFGDMEKQNNRVF